MIERAHAQPVARGNQGQTQQAQRDAERARAPHGLKQHFGLVQLALAFVGLGPRDGVSLGGLLDQGVVSMLRAPHVLVVAATCVFVTSSALLLAGRAADSRPS